MKKYKTILVDKESLVATIRLNRLDVHNAFNDVMMSEIVEALEGIDNTDARLIVLTASGPDFCSGADLNWMRECSANNRNETERSSESLHKLYSKIRSLSVPLVSRVFGNVFAGGVGLCAASDIVYAEEGTDFCISEARVGLIPAVMSPFVVARIGIPRFRELVLTARKFNALEALQMGLIDFVLPKEVADEYFSDSLRSILKNGPEALSASKSLCRHLESYDWNRNSQDLVGMIAERRASAEGQEGVKAFLEKRPPKWRMP